MQNKEIFRCSCVRENGKICGNPLYAVKNGEITIKRHGREVYLTAGQHAEIKCERCGGITKVGEI